MEQKENKNETNLENGSDCLRRLEAAQNPEEIIAMEEDLANLVYGKGKENPMLWEKTSIKKILELLDKRYASFSEKGQPVTPTPFQFFDLLYNIRTVDDNGANESAADVFAEALTERISSGQSVHSSLNEAIGSIWGQNLQAIAVEKRYDLLLSLIDHRQTVDPYLFETLALGSSLVARDLIAFIHKKITSSTLRGDESIRALRLLEMIKASCLNQAGFKDTEKSANDAVEKLKHSNHFLTALYANSDAFASSHDEEHKKLTAHRQLARKYFKDTNDPTEKHHISTVSPELNAFYDGYGNFLGFIDGKNTKFSLDEAFSLEGLSRKTANSEEYDAYISEYQVLMFLPIRQAIENIFGVSLSDYSVRQQLQLLHYISRASTKNAAKLNQFLQKGEKEQNRADRFRSFLSLEIDPSLSEGLLEIDSRLDPKSSSRMFAAFSQTIPSLDEIEKLSRSSLPENANTHFETTSIYQTALKKAVEFLKKAALSNNPANIIKNYSADVALTSSILKELKNRGIRPEQLKEVSFSVLSSDELNNNQKLKDQMLAIYRQNWEEEHKKPKRFVEAIVNGLKNKIESPNSNSRFFIYQKNNQIIAFVREDTVNENTRYFGALNVRPEAQDAAIGFVLLEKTLEPAKKRFDIAAHTDPFNKHATETYVERTGFIIDGYESNFLDTGEAQFKIKLRQKPIKSVLKDLNKERLVMLAHGIKPEHPGDQAIVKHFQLSSLEMKQAMEEYLNRQNYVITRLFYDLNDGVYIGFEKI